MIVKFATVNDVEEMVNLGRVGHALSNHSHVEFDENIAGALGMRAILNDEMCAVVAKYKGQVVGLLIGAIQDWPFLKWKVASDLVMFAGRPGSGRAMLRFFEQWAWKIGANEILLGVTFGAANKPNDAIYSRLGYAKLGGMFSKQKG